MFGGGGLPPSITNTYSDAFKWLNFLSPHYFVTNIAAGAMNPLSAESILTNLNFSDPEFAADLQIIADWVETD
ncbi:MAG: hypothetical protein DRP42_00870 [Tenericutes bacterium]|nr:MAG: hypothetical protein DRP42_00870 [Mycoplasmatota bacterium]